MRTTFWERFTTIAIKELRQLALNKSLVIQMLIPPIFQVAVLGLALSADVKHISLVIYDESRSAESRDLVAAVGANAAFDVTRRALSRTEALEILRQGKVDGVVLIPPDYQRSVTSGNAPATVQFLLNGTNSNTAQTASVYFKSTLSAYRPQAPPRIIVNNALTYNPGLTGSWFTVTGAFGVLLLFNSLLLGASTMVREKDSGTIEQLLMTPAGTTETILAKILPIFVVMVCSGLLILLAARLMFGVPIRGSLLLMTLAIALMALSGIAVGTFLATYSRNSQQSQLLSFFIAPPLALLSGALTPLEAIPATIQPFTLLNPVRHFGQITRAILLKGATFSDVWVNFAFLAAITLILLALSVRKFRTQLV